MDKLSESRLSMQLGTTNFLKANSLVFSLLPGYTPLLTLLDSNVNQIIQVGQVQGANRTGVAQAKSNFRVTLAAITFKVANLVKVYANANSNPELARLVHCYESDLLRVADTKLNEHALLVQSKALEFLTELAPYGVTAAMMDELEAAISAFFDSIDKPAAAITLTKDATQQVKNLLKENDTVLAKIDNLAEIIRFTHVDVYRNYHTTRNVIETGKRYVALKATAKNAANNQPLSGVLFQFGPMDGSIVPIGVPAPQVYIKKTASKGSFLIKTMVPGSYQLIVSKNGFQSQNLTVYVNEGEMTNVTVALDPVGS